MIEFSCSFEAKQNIIHAIQCVDVNEIQHLKILFVCVDSSDARRLVMENYVDFEIIVISEFVVPRDWRTEDNWSKRYFNYLILHEIAHALLKHKSPRSIDADDNEIQENDADDLAMKWLNNYLALKNMGEYSKMELEKAQNMIQDYRKKYLIL